MDVSNLAAAPPVVARGVTVDTGSPPRESGAEVAKSVWTRSLRWALLASLIGAGVVSVFLIVAFPTILDAGEAADFRLEGAIGTPIYMAISVPIVLIRRRRRFSAATAWLHEERPPTASERRATLGQPREFLIESAPAWLGAALVFGIIGATHSAAAGLSIGIGIVLGGLAASALAYLLLERAGRPVTARALAAAPPERPVTPGVTTRLTMAWTLATGVPLLGALALAISYLAGADFDPGEGFVAVTSLLAVGLVFGLAAILVAARSVADPVIAMRSALGRVQDGDFEARVAIDDASEVGLLQAGFNEMAAGLAERERIREAFGTYVDRDVAEHILREGTSLAGEEVEVTMLFLDIRGFTTFAERLSASEVVATLNRLFERIVPIIHAHSGHIDKYVGDGLLAVFGAPRRQEDHADQALAAGLEIAAAVADEFGDSLSVGVGLNSGPVVAGNVGGAGRLEFSVIGDPVNVAARVESATRQTGDLVLIAGRTKELLKDSPQMSFVERPGLALKGKTQPVAVYAPILSPPVAPEVAPG